MLNVNTSNKWTRALWEPAAGVVATKPCVELCDLHGQNDFQLVLVDESAVPCRLKLFKGLRVAVESMMAEVPTGIVSFVCDVGNSESTCLAVACGSSLLVYRNMKPYYRYKVPQKDILPAESELWNRMKQCKIQKSQLIDGLKQLQLEYSIGVMSFQSQQLLTLNSADDGTAEENIQSEFIDFVLKKETRGGEGESEVQLQNVHITSVATIPRNQSQTSTVDVLILGTERGSVYFVDSQAYTVLQRNAIGGAVPVKMLPVGHFDLEFRLIVCTREHDVFVLRRSAKGEFSVNSFYIREHPFDVVLCANQLAFATRKRCLVFFSLKGRRQNSMKFDESIADIEQFYYEPKQYSGVLVAVANEIHLFVDQLRVDTIRMDQPIEWMRYGRMGREEGVLVIATFGGGLCVKIFRRVANFEENRQTMAQRKATKGSIELPKKSRTFIDQSLRERQNAQLLHQIYQRDWFMIKWHATKTFAELKSGKHGALPTADSDEPVQVQFDLLGFGPLFRLKIRLVASKKLDGQQRRWITFVYNAEEYQFTEQMLPIPRPLMPNRPVTFCTNIRCLHPEKQLVEEEVKLVLCREDRSRPIWTANFQMPLSEAEIV
ncbi:hypothetical protein niasHT_008069 [Heterodera trifolii]|uniref:BBS1 domain-containing protein n=1 Tax=Heterodera trifolii TaxID=157864 RepID=A0ABD2M0Z6_9BILA